LTGKSRKIFPDFDKGVGPGQENSDFTLGEGVDLFALRNDFRQVLLDFFPDEFTVF